MILLRDRNLNIAILISLCWHFCCMFLFNPTLPAGNAREYRTSISFLGGILGNVIAGNGKPLTPANVLVEHKMSKFEPVETGLINIQPEKKDLLYSSDSRALLDSNAYRKKENTRVNFSDFFIKGEAKDRIVIYKPDLDEVNVLPSDFSSDFSSNIKFRISKDGFVKYAECVISSGFPEMDQAAIRYIRKWQFVPNAEDNQEGIVRVSFK
jgi:TonB family protein